MWPKEGLGERITVLHQGALGDFVAALPMMEALAGRNSGGCVVLVTRPAHGTLVSELPWILSTHPAGGPEITPWYDDETAGRAPLPRWMEGAGGLAVFGGDAAAGLAARLSRRAGVPALFIRSIPPLDAREQVTISFHRQAREQGLDLPLRPPRVPVRPAAGAAALEWLSARGVSGHVHLHPGSGGARKVWPAREWLAVARALRKRGVPVVVSLGPADDALRPLAGALSSLGCAIAAGLDLPVLVALLSLARAYAGSDSGVTHLAAAAGVPTVAVFGPTDPEVWAPLGENVRVVRREWRREQVFELTREPGEPDREILGLLAARAGGAPLRPPG